MPNRLNPLVARGVSTPADAAEFTRQNIQVVADALANPIVQDWGTATGARTLDVKIADVNRLILGASVALTLSVAAVPDRTTVRLVLTQDGTGSRTVTAWTNVTWINGATPTLRTAANTFDVFEFTYFQSLAVWIGRYETGYYVTAPGGVNAGGALLSNGVLNLSNVVGRARIFAGTTGLTVRDASDSTDLLDIDGAGKATATLLRAPHGSAPGSPVNGDIWTTTAGLFVRVNGATVGPLAGAPSPTTTVGVGITPAAITPATTGLTWSVVGGDDGAGKTFIDVLLFNGATNTRVVLTSTTIDGAPPARTYSMSGGALQLSINPGSYTINAQLLRLS